MNKINKCDGLMQVGDSLRKLSWWRINHIDGRKLSFAELIDKTSGYVFCKIDVALNTEYIFDSFN